MAPVPLRGRECEIAMVAFSAALVAHARAEAGVAQEAATYQALWDNACRLLGHVGVEVPACSVATEEGKSVAAGEDDSPATCDVRQNAKAPMASEYPAVVMPSNAVHGAVDERPVADRHEVEPQHSSAAQRG
jgi:hypothetical protein